MKSILDIIKIITIKTPKIIWLLSLNAFLLILILVFVDFIIGGLVFYDYVFSADKEQPKITGSIIKFDDETYQKVLGELQARDQNSGESQDNISQ